MPHFEATIRFPAKDRREAEAIAESMSLNADMYLHSPGYKPRCVNLAVAEGQRNPEHEHRWCEAPEDSNLIYCNMQDCPTQGKRQMAFVSFNECYGKAWCHPKRHGHTRTEPSEAQAILGAE